MHLPDTLGVLIFTVETLFEQEASCLTISECCLLLEMRCDVMWACKLLVVFSNSPKSKQALAVDMHRERSEGTFRGDRINSCISSFPIFL